ncbi:MAG: calcium-translocating P-type ATPase, PMCA-type [Alistipes sp.]|nr:calcium-translocating P-type ATPase, PMCA-type [Alistipes sp.]
MSKTKNSYLSTALISTSEEVELGKGQNIIPPAERESLWRTYLEKFKDPIIIVLLVVFLFSVIVALYEIFVVGKGFDLLLEPSGVLMALLLATGVGFIFEVKAAREFDILNKVKDSRPVKVYRRRTAAERALLVSISKQDVVVGDIVRLESGDEIPADGYLVDAVQLRVDESNFTGETYANKYLNEEDFDADATYPSNFLLRGATVIEGSAVMRVSAVGTATEEGRGVAKANEGSDVETPLNQQLAQLGAWISKASFIIASLIIIGRIVSFLFFESTPLSELSFIEIAEFALASVMIAVTLIVVAVPEGLPMSITISLALSMRRMLKQKSLVRKLHACETMGAATVICTDKTGTLTMNRMTVVEYLPLGNDLESLLVDSMAVNSTAELGEEDGREVVIGNPTEGALLVWLRSKGVDYREVRDRYQIISQQPFSTETKYMASEVIDTATGKRLRLVKGAPEIVMAMCKSIAGERERSDIEQQLLGFQSRAMRTLGFAIEQMDEGKGLTFVGIIGIADPIRDDVREAIETCRNNAGVRVIIVTGDTPGTATEIGRQLGLIEGIEGEVITGPYFARLSDEEARAMLSTPTLKIIARARPDDKARLVMLLQENGEVVAVTGDGTNDAPALSKAQVGLSMGDGTSRAKEASDITIIDNSFASINRAIMWGRSLYLNIRRFIIFQMTINLSACLIVLLGAFIGLESPLTVTQMLWVNLIMDTFAAMALSSLPADRGVLNEPPRKPSSHIISRRMLRRIVGAGLSFFVILVALWQLLHHVEISCVRDIISSESLSHFAESLGSMSGKAEPLTRYELGVFFSVFVILQFWNMFNAKYFATRRSLILDIIDLVRNPQAVKESFSLYFVLISVVIVAGQILIVNFASDLFGVAPLSTYDWLWILLLTSPVLLLADIVRLIRR